MVSPLAKILAIALVVLACGLAVWARQSSLVFQDCQRGQYQAQAAGEEQVKDTPLAFERILAPYCTARFITAHNAVITAISTVLLTIVTGGLVWAGLRQIQTNRAQLRAYVFPDNAGLYEGSMMDPPMEAHLNEPMAILVSKNSGQTPATEVISWGAMDVIEPINEHRLTIPTLRKGFSLTLGREATFPKNFFLGRALTESEMEDVRARVKAIYVYGRIEYRDIFGANRFTNFRLAYAGPFPPPQGVVFSFCENGNDTDPHYG